MKFSLDIIVEAANTTCYLVKTSVWLDSDSSDKRVINKNEYDINSNTHKSTSNTSKFLTVDDINALYKYIIEACPIISI